MGGGLLQLVAYGAQDAYLTGNPQITFWRGLFKRHTNFAMEPFRVNLTGQAAWGTKHSAILGRHADLISSAYLEVEMPAEVAGAQLVYTGGGTSTIQRRAGFNLLEYVELDIGGQVIDRLYGEFMFLWSTLAYTTDAREKMDALANTVLVPNGSCNNTTGRPFRSNLTYIPLMFFFARNPGTALPLIALQYHEVKINILWNKAKSIFKPAIGTVVQQTSSGPAQANLLVDYIYLDVDERRRMAQESHEYLIEQTQFNEDKGFATAQNRIDLTFNHPVKELIWVTQYSWRKACTAPVPTASVAPPAVNALGGLTYDALIYNCSLQLNGQDRVPSLPEEYYAAVQPYQHHSGGMFEDAAGTVGGVYMYSFALKPEEHQPSGTCNFSRIDTATLVFSVDGSKQVSMDDAYNADIRVYAINYNILRIMSGMAGLAYSN